MLQRLFLSVIVAALWISPWTIANAQTRANPLDSLVSVQSVIRSDARTRDVLGSARQGTGVVVDDAGLVLTIGYLILEAESVDVHTRSGQVLPATVLAYHSETGLGLLRVQGKMDASAVSLGKSEALSKGSELILGGYGGQQSVQQVIVSDRSTFTGSWEYLLDRAIFTVPGHPNIAGAGLFDNGGALVGIGYLTVAQRLASGGAVPSNMFVPIEVLTPVFADLITTGRSAGPTRPWLGLFLEQTRGRLFVERIADGGPADQAGLAKDDLILAVDGVSTNYREQFYRTLWKGHVAGDPVELTVLKGVSVKTVTLMSMDRYQWYKTKGRTY